ncbi:MAG TPA: DsrE/DsrF/DrsH-like family protein [Acidiferrobacter sp.]|nr:DsrE/DsrF/DrsH-like family protein [Acidiferrobacter sp.]
MSESLSVIVTSGTREKLQMAAMITAVAAAGGTDVAVFVSMNALLFFHKDGAPEAPPEGEVGRLLLAKKAPRFLELFEQAVELGSVKIYPCSMAMDVLALEPEDLAAYVEKPVGLTKFLSELDGSHVLTF